MTRPPVQLSVLEVINALDPLRRIESCPLGLEKHDSGSCPLHERLDSVVARAEAAFASVTIEDLVREPAESTPLGLSHLRMGSQNGVEAT